MEDLLKLPFTHTEQVSVDKKKKHHLFEKRRGRMLMEFWNALFLVGVFGEVSTDHCWCSESGISPSPSSAACQLYPSTAAESISEG